MSRRPKQRRFRAGRGHRSSLLGELTLNIRTVAWLARRFGRLARRDLRRQFTLVQRRLR